MGFSFYGYSILFVIKTREKSIAKTTQILQQHSRSTKGSVFTSQVCACILYDKYLFILHKKIITAYCDKPLETHEYILWGKTQHLKVKYTGRSSNQ